MLTSVSRNLTGVKKIASLTARALSTVPPARLFDYETIKANLTVADAIESVGGAFAALAKGKVDVPMPMHITVNESANTGPGDCHIKGGYIDGTPTFTVKLATVSFYKNASKGIPPGSGVFCVVSAENGAPLGIFQENRFMTDLRTGAAGAIALKHCSDDSHDTIGFIGCGAIARNMARASAVIRPFKGVAYGFAGTADAFCKEMEEELGMPFTAVETAEDLCGKSDVIFTQTPGSETVLELGWLKTTGVTIIASGSDQPTKNEIPIDVLKAGKYVSDLTKQTSKVGELRVALQAGEMTEDDVYAELGEIVGGSKPGREGNEIIVVDLTGTGAQDAAIGQVAWDKLSKL